MQVLLMDRPSPRCARFCDLMRAGGHEVTVVPALERAMGRVRSHPLDLLISVLFPNGNRPGAPTGLSLLLAAQQHNPSMHALLLSEEMLFAHGELFMMLSSLRCVLPAELTAEDLHAACVNVVRTIEAHEREAHLPEVCAKCYVRHQCVHAAEGRTCSSPQPEAGQPEAVRVPSGRFGS